MKRKRFPQKPENLRFHDVTGFFLSRRFWVVLTCLLVFVSISFIYVSKSVPAVFVDSAVRAADWPDRTSRPGFLTLCCFLQGDKFDEPCNGLDCSRGCQCLPQKGARVSHHSHTCTKHVYCAHTCTLLTWNLFICGLNSWMHFIQTSQIFFGIVELLKTQFWGFSLGSTSS